MTTVMKMWGSYFWYSKEISIWGKRTTYSSHVKLKFQFLCIFAHLQKCKCKTRYWPFMSIRPAIRMLVLFRQINLGQIWRNDSLGPGSFNFILKHSTLVYQQVPQILTLIQCLSFDFCPYLLIFWPPCLFFCVDTSKKAWYAKHLAPCARRILFEIYHTSLNST